MNIGALNHSTVITLGNPVNIFMLIIQSTYLQQTFSCRSACSCIVHYLSHICDRYENEAKFLSVTDMSQIVFYRYITDILQNWYVYMSHICQFGKGNALGSAPPGGEGLQNEKNNVNIYMYSVTTLSVSHCYEGTSTNMFTKVCHIFITWFFYVVLFISITNALLKQNAINFEFDNYY